MKLDAHVHTVHSGRTSIWPLDALSSTSRIPPPGRHTRVPRRAGMDLVAITDHNSIDGALALADRPDVIVGCEVSAGLSRGSRMEAHLGVLDISPRQFLEIADSSRQRRPLAARTSVVEGIFTVLNHPASQVNGRDRASPAGGDPAVGRRGRGDERHATAGAERGMARVDRCRRGQAGRGRQRLAYPARHRPHVYGRRRRAHARGIHDWSPGGPRAGRRRPRAAISRWPPTSSGSRPASTGRAGTPGAGTPAGWQAVLAATS